MKWSISRLIVAMLVTIATMLALAVKEKPVRTGGASTYQGEVVNNH